VLAGFDTKRRATRLSFGAFVATLLALALPLAGPASEAPPGLPREPFGPASTVSSRRGVVSSAETNASRVGAAVLAEGGNAVDAAVATAFALAVTYPEAGNLAGGGFAVVRTEDGTFWALDFRETAPAGTWEKSFLLADGSPRGNASLSGGLSVATPGTVRGMALLHGTLGRLPWRRVVEPAVALARDGFLVPEWLTADLAQQAARISSHPETRRIFFPGGTPIPAGSRLAQPELAATLESIAARGPDAFHRGPIASRIAARVRETGGVLTEQDLAGYAPVFRPPVVFDYGRWRLVTMPPPTAGGILLQEILAQLEVAAGDLAALPPDARIHLLAEAERRAFADRNEFIGDPDCVPMPLARLLAPERLAALGASIDPGKATPSSSIRPGGVADGGTSTTHLSVATAEGGAVAMTYTLNETFGNGDVVPGVGVLLNNEMDDFAVHPGRPNLFGLVQGASNAVRPGARPASSMTPLVVLESGRPRFVLGSPGGSTIPSSVLQVFLAAGPLGMPFQEAVGAARIHHQHLPDRLEVERGVFPEELKEALRARGHVVHERGTTSTWGRLGAVNAASFEKDGTLLGVADPRRGGRPASVEECIPPSRR
jgi:gamma-glutamyltranspeptidase/glutathione hydrolase